jgi:hypothetical protein
VHINQHMQAVDQPVYRSNVSVIAWQCGIMHFTMPSLNDSLVVERIPVSIVGAVSQPERVLLLLLLLLLLLILFFPNNSAIFFPNPFRTFISTL